MEKLIIKDLIDRFPLQGLNISLTEFISVLSRSEKLRNMYQDLRLVYVLDPFECLSYLNCYGIRYETDTEYSNRQLQAESIKRKILAKKKSELLAQIEDIDKELQEFEIELEDPISEDGPF